MLDIIACMLQQIKKISLRTFYCRLRQFKSGYWLTDEIMHNDKPKKDLLKQ